MEIAGTPEAPLITHMTTTTNDSDNDNDAISADDAERLGAFTEDALAESDALIAVNGDFESPAEAMREIASQQ